MGLIRSGATQLTPESDDQDLIQLLWPIVREMIKTAIENRQHLIVEGCYLPFDWQNDFEEEYLKEIQYLCLIMSETYIRNHFNDIKKHANVIEHRLDDSCCTMEHIIKDNLTMLRQAQNYDVPYLLIDDKYQIDLDLFQ